ncbi:hypothetical protein RFI36_07115 [Acinetobacter gerneri]|mgnify:CR=1 FL=1|uniref:Uncharacterized protein n=1 Tax=Acinetobacter gerneri TaxID=202952 RepID=A0AAW8JGT3_9GAMM|nr:hypothetical protein [Acinetobacter gerneri]MDQ9009506.1 hypothetical protein [Acinetobacter gerneri]MDQ9013611.1 hypothetical protein [Acinetobacter gerneri]MDQ9024825.1 hypothetical protein [Acinetobacter gerneri]MDQ9052348.1 hypothetical protein [Acinetobacter gerneri]MDQ9059927.1 hypothetical protein [Acinetobacter gerneri]
MDLRRQLNPSFVRPKEAKVFVGQMGYIPVTLAQRTASCLVVIADIYNVLMVWIVIYQELEI